MSRILQSVFDTDCAKHQDDTPRVTGWSPAVPRLKFLVLGSISDRFHYQYDLEQVSRPVKTLGLDHVSKRPFPKQP